MLKKRKIIAPFMILFATLVFLALPVSTEARQANRVVRAALEGTMTLQREDGSIFIIDNTATMWVGYRGRQIVIDVIHAGVVQETGEQVDIRLTAVGNWQRNGNQIEGDLAGLLTVTRANGNQITIDMTASYVVTRLSDSTIQLTINGNGVVQGSGENIVIDVIGAGVISE